MKSVVYMLIGGAPLTDIIELSTQNINMAIDIFLSLDINVITVSVRNTKKDCVV